MFLGDGQAARSVGPASWTGMPGRPRDSENIQGSERIKFSIPNARFWALSGQIGPSPVLISIQCRFAIHCNIDSIKTVTSRSSDAVSFRTHHFLIQFY